MPELLSPHEAVKRADKVKSAAIRAALGGKEKARLTKAPAGAGKTQAVIELVGTLAKADARVGVAAQTNEQAFEIVDRLSALHKKQKVCFLPALGVTLPAKIAERRNVEIIDTKTLVRAPLVVATSHKWAYSAKDLDPDAFDNGVVDEIYQMSSSLLLRTGGLFATLDGVGDHGQLDPFSVVSDERWAGLPTNPVLNAVDALLAHHPDVPQRELTVTRRLPASAADVVRRAFYPDLDFGPSSKPGDREFRLQNRGRGQEALVRKVWDTAAAHGWAFLELPARPTQQVDGQAVERIADLVEGLLGRKPLVIDERTGPAGRAFTADRLAVGVAHRDQRAAVTVALQQRGIDDVVVDTANRLQGREFDVLVVLHPLSGRIDATDFHIDAGRLCVLCTRHRQACVVVGRGGMEELLEAHPPPGDVILGVQRERTFEGWDAHVEVLRHLRTVAIPAG